MKGSSTKFLMILSPIGNMNARILDLIKNPETLSPDDLKILEAEIKKYPYSQSFRAIYLYATHQLQPEIYKNVLATTAAYTTDKKILYQFINGEIAVETSSKSEKEERQLVTSSKFDYTTAIKRAEEKADQPVYINGELNRLLFEGEEDFFDRPDEVIDLESTIESGQIVTEMPESKTVIPVQKTTVEPIESLEKNPGSEDFSEKFNEKSDGFPAADAEDLTEEKIAGEQNILQETNEVEDPSELSFHAMDAFLPNVSMKVTPSEKSPVQAPISSTKNRHEDEMQRLLAEVEAKMKSNQKTKIKEEIQEEPSGNEINFMPDYAAPTENQESQNQENQKITEEKLLHKTDNTSAKISIEAVKTESTKIPQKPTEISQETSEWKPMNFSFSTPDAVLKFEDQKKAEVPQLTITEENRPVLNASFLGNPINVEQTRPIQKEPVEKQESNVPQFINTWQGWLKLERPKSVEKPVDNGLKPEEAKEKAIEKFIETEPRISQLKEDQSFTVKEKTDDISHLMTETLARLYTEQRLYAKATKAYEILKEKFPDKVADYDIKIQEIKDLKLGNKPQN